VSVKKIEGSTSHDNSNRGNLVVIAKMFVAGVVVIAAIGVTDGSMTAGAVRGCSRLLSPDELAADRLL
jgi:hypothetical protein